VRKTFALLIFFIIFAYYFKIMGKKKTEFKMEKTPPKIKLGEVFEVEGKLYSIQVPQTASEQTRLSDGREIFEFFYMTE